MITMSEYRPNHKMACDGKHVTLYLIGIAEFGLYKIGSTTYEVESRIRAMQIPFKVEVFATRKGQRRKEKILHLLNAPFQHPFGGTEWFEFADHERAVQAFLTDTPYDTDVFKTFIDTAEFVDDAFWKLNLYVSRLSR